MRREHALILVALAVLAAASYLHLFTQPLLQDDYPNIEQARIYGPPPGWRAMLADPAFRYRATFWIMTSALDRMAGPSAPAFYFVCILLHVFCTWLVYALGGWRVIGWRISAVAAAFFAVAEGHQEAVMWYSANCELLMFAFGLLSLLCWIGFVDHKRGWRWYAASLVLFVLALFSKESAWIFALLFLLPIWAGRPGRRPLWAWLGFAALAGGYIALVMNGRGSSFRFADGSFSLAAPFWITLPVSYLRLFWFWGVLAFAVLVLLRVKPLRQVVVMGLIWPAVALAPYAFLTYMYRIPSRQTYLASLGLAWVVSAGFWALYTRLRHKRRTVLASIGVLVIVVNSGTLWTKKHRQFAERAAPVEALLTLLRQTEGRIHMQCYPDPPIDYEAAVRLMTGKPSSVLIWNPQDHTDAAATFCYTGEPQWIKREK